MRSVDLLKFETSIPGLPVDLLKFHRVLLIGFRARRSVLGDGPCPLPL